MKNASTNAASEGNGYKKRSQLGSVCRRFAKSRTAMAGLLILALLVLIAACCPLFLNYTQDVVGQNIRQRLQPPCLAHPFGTDQYGRDVLARVLWGTRISLSASLVIITAATVFGALFGALSAYYGGRVDNLIMRVMDVFYALPFNLMAICIVASLGNGIFNLGLACVIGVIPGFTRVFRAAILPIRNQEYIEAARACNTTDWRILTKHILPNALGPIIVQATLNLAITILAIAGLSFIGLGIQAPTPEWGAMLSEGREQMRNYPYLVIFPGLAIMVSAMSLNLIGDGLRDALDPKLKN
ncbi:MAG: ABC transporter permease [Oscillospiraceae bacterium]|nr:ABC transporter permease [Oscillospiraceae bacterium]